MGSDKRTEAMAQDQVRPSKYPPVLRLATLIREIAPFFQRAPGSYLEKSTDSLP